MLIVGSALAAFLLGVVVTMWLGTGSLSATPPASPQAEVGSNTPAENRTSLPGGTLPNSAQAQATQPAVSGPAQPTAATPVRSSPTVTDSAAASASVPSAAKPSVSRVGEFSLQLGAFLDAAKAKSLAAELLARGYTSDAIDAPDGYGRAWHYLRLGAFPDEEAADRAAADLLLRAGIGATVIRSSAASAGH
jgi:cell division protein FtsN